jgi:hypothetical protein
MLCPCNVLSVFHKFLLPLLVAAGMTVPIPNDPSVTNSNVNISHPTSSSAPAPVKIATPSKTDPVQISESKEVDKESDESEESDESDESSESQNSKEEGPSPPHLADVTKTPVQTGNEDSIDASTSNQENKTEVLSNTSVTSLTKAETGAPFKISEPEVTTASVATIISDVTFSPSLKLEPEVPLSLNIK